jgi:hypothetical protein
MIVLSLEVPISLGGVGVRRLGYCSPSIGCYCVPGSFSCSVSVSKSE